MSRPASHLSRVPKTLPDNGAARVETAGLPGGSSDVPQTNDFSLLRGIIETVRAMTPEESRRMEEDLRAKWEHIGPAFPLYTLLLLLSNDSPFEWRNLSHPVADAQAARILSISERRAKRWRRLLVKAKLAIFLSTPKGFVVLVRDNPAMRQFLSQVIEMGRNAERGQLSAQASAAEVELERAQLLESWPVNGSSWTN